MSDWPYPTEVPRSANHPLPIDVQLYVHALSELCPLDSTFRADFYLKLAWHAPAPPDGEVERAWRPRYEIMNKKEVDESYRALTYDAADERYDYTVRATGTFRIVGIQEQLGHFPFDTQYLTVDLSFWDEVDAIALILDDERQQGAAGYRNDELFVVYAGCDQQTPHMTLSNMVDLSEWQVGAGFASIRTFSHQYKAMFGRHPRLQWEVPVRRKHEYYFYKILSVAAVCNLICGVAFFVPVADVGTRISIAVTIFLALVAFQFVVTESLPKTSEQTRIDKFFVASYLFAASVLVQSVLLEFLASPSRIDLSAGAVSLINWGCFAVYALCNVWVASALLREAYTHRKAHWDPNRDAPNHRLAVRRFLDPAAPVRTLTAQRNRAG